MKKWNVTKVLSVRLEVQTCLPHETVLTCMSIRAQCVYLLNPARKPMLIQTGFQ